MQARLLYYSWMHQKISRTSEPIRKDICPYGDGNAADKNSWYTEATNVISKIQNHPMKIFPSVNCIFKDQIYFNAIRPPNYYKIWNSQFVS